jgi:hypothetical protein
MPRFRKAKGSAVRKAAELTALSEDSRALVLQDGPGNVGATLVMVRLQGAASRAVQALRIPAANAAAPVQPLQDYLAGRAAAEEAEQ